MIIGLGLGLSFTGARASIPIAPDYVEPAELDEAAPVGEPVPPTTTPIDPARNEPEPGIDPAFSEPERIEIADSGQTSVRTSQDPATFGVSYIASSLIGGEYWEFEVQAGTPKNATFAVGITTLDMPLNGVPGERATEIAWWSDGTIRQGGVTILDLGASGKLATKDKAAIGIDAAGGVFLWKDCAALNAGAAVGTLATEAAVYPFAGLYSEKTRVNFKFASSKFNCALPSGFYPIGQVPGEVQVGQIMGAIIRKVPEQTVQIAQLLGAIIYKETV